MKLLRYYKLMLIFAIVLLTQAMTCESFDIEPKFPKNAKGHPEYELPNANIPLQP